MITVEELLLRRYSNINYILNKDWIDGMHFISKAFEKEQEEILFQAYINESYIDMTFDEYKEKAICRPYQKMKVSEIDELLEKSEKIIKRRD